MTEEKVYKINVGSRENKAMIGYLEKGGMSSIVKGATVPAQQLGGFVIFPNRSIAWARRLIKGKPVPGRLIQPTDVDYSGEVEFMDWGAEGGNPMVIRWKYSCSTLDYDFQITRLQLPKFEQDENGCYLELAYGENKLFYDSEPLKIDFLKQHYQNGDSKSKSPNASDAMWWEVKRFDTTKQEVKAMDYMFEAMTIIKRSATFAHLKVLQAVMATKKTITYEPTKEESLYDGLVLFAKEQPDVFMAAIDLYKIKVQEIFAKAVSFKAIDVTKDGVIAVTQPQKEILFSDIPDAKGEAMIEWVFVNALEPKVHEGIDKLFHLSAKFK
jgi:hypothetical protein